MWSWEQWSKQSEANKRASKSGWLVCRKKKLFALEGFQPGISAFGIKFGEQASKENRKAFEKQTTRKLGFKTSVLNLTRVKRRLDTRGGPKNLHKPLSEKPAIYLQALWS